MNSFYKKAIEALECNLKGRDAFASKGMVKDIADEYAQLASQWQNGAFELRDKQLLFTYECISSTLNPNKAPVALSLACGEGKQEGFAVAIKLSYKFLKQKKKTAKLFFITATTDLMEQMKNSLPLKNLPYVYRVGKDISYKDAKQEGIYLCDFATYLKLSLLQKKGASVKLFKNLDRIFADEFHALLSSSKHIISNEPNVNYHNAEKKRKYLLKFLAYKRIMKDVVSLQAEFPKAIAHSRKRNHATFNPYRLTKDGVVLQRYLYKKYLNTQDDNPLKALGIASYFEFLALLDKTADAVSKQPGKDYYLFKDNDIITDYCTAQRFTGKPMKNTVFLDKEFATLVMLKHTNDFTKDVYKKEFMLLSRIYLSETLYEISPIEAILMHNPSNFTVASATLKGVSKQLDYLNFKTLFLQAEPVLSLDDKNVSITQASKENTPLDIVKNLNLKNSTFEAVAITAQSSKTLSDLADLLEKENLYGYEVIRLYRNPINPNDELFEDEIVNLQEQIYKEPNKKRIILIQGLGEGSNIFKTTPNNNYSAKLIKLDIDAIDKVTHTRYRIGAKGRANGTFCHRFSTNLTHSSNLKLEEVEILNKSKNKAKTLIEIQTKILEDMDDSAVAVNISSNLTSDNKSSRRNFLKKLGLGLAATAAAPAIIPSLTKDAEAYYSVYNYKNLPPGIKKCRDKEIINAYVMYRASEGLNNTVFYKGVDVVRIFCGIMRISNTQYFPIEFGEVRRSTPFIEPAYWYLCAWADMPHFPIMDELEKKNPILTQFMNGIYNYFREWVYYNKGYYDLKTEDHLLMTIFGAAGYNKEKKLDEYYKANFNGKKEIIIETADVFKNMHINPKPDKINDNYDKALTAQWASYWLTRHYNRTYGYNGKMTVLIWSELEQDGFRKMNNGKIDLRIRGPPNYIEKF